MTTKILFVKFIYTNGKTSSSAVKKSIKYYEDNGRGKVKIQHKVISEKVPYEKKQFNKAKKMVREKVLKQYPDYDCYVLICNPRRSQAGGKFVITHQSSVNMIHELGHFFGFSHANSLLSGIKQSSRDPFDQMTIFSPYPSTNSPHRVQNKWLLDNELITGESGTYTIGQLKQFKDTTTAKIVKSPNSHRYYISYGIKNSVNYVVVHTVYGKNSSFIIGMYRLKEGKTYYNEIAEITIKCIEFNKDILTFELVCEEYDESDYEMIECSDFLSEGMSEDELEE